MQMREAGWHRAACERGHYHVQFRPGAGAAVEGGVARVCSTRKPTGLIVMLGVILVLGGCVGGGGGTSGDQPANRRELVIGVDEIPTTLDPAQNFDQIPIAILHLVAGTLFNVAPDGKSVSMGLAASMQQDDDRLIVKLKPGLKFSDGSALTAADVVASFDFYLHDKTNGYLTSDFASIAKVTAVDDLTVMFDLKYPYPSLPFALAQAEMAILPSQSIEAKGASAEKPFAGAPLPSAGQFRVQSLTTNEIILHANPYYAGSRPSVKTLIFKQIVDPDTRLAGVQSGQLDYADDIPPKETGQLSAPVEVRTVQAAFGTQFLQMNNRPNSLLSDVRIRKAISLAVDRNQINQIAYGGNASPSLGLFSKSSKFYKPFVSPDPDVASAKKLLAGTKCAKGCTLDMIAISGSQTGIDTATVVQQNLKAIGINVRVQLSPAAVIAEDLNQGNFDLSPTGLYFTDGVADSILYWSIGSYLAGWSGYSNPEVEQLIQTAKTTQGSALAAAVGKANAIFERDLPFTPLVGFPVVAASRIPTKLFGTDPLSSTMSASYPRPSMAEPPKPDPEEGRPHDGTCPRSVGVGPQIGIVALVVTVGTDLLVRLVPGDPARTILGDRAPPEEVNALRQELGLDQPVLRQVGDALVKLAHGDLGTSFVYRGQNVTTLIVPGLGVTASLALSAVVLSLLVGIPLGLGARAGPPLRS